MCIFFSFFVKNFNIALEKFQVMHAETIFYIYEEFMNYYRSPWIKKPVHHQIEKNLVWYVNWWSSVDNRDCDMAREKGESYSDVHYTYNIINPQ